MKNNHLVSVVVATHDSINTIEKCLSSIKHQTYPFIEIIVVDSITYSKKNQKKCKSIIEKYATYVQDGPERSIQRNRGIKLSKGKYVLIIDQDMYLTKNVVNECVLAIQNKNVAGVLIPEISIGEGFWTKCVSLERYVSVYLEDALNECLRFFRKKDAITVGCFDPGIVGAEDSDFHYKICKIGKSIKINAHINHDEGITSFWKRVSKKYYYSKAFRKYLNRYPEIAPKQFSPFKKAYLTHWNILLEKPHLVVGIAMLRSAEVIAGLLGILFNR